MAASADLLEKKNDHLKVLREKILYGKMKLDESEVARAMAQ
jgi:hypothetical protein